MFDDIDESKLDPIERLGLAYCRLNSWEWDEILGPKPEGFDELPNYDGKKGRIFHKKIRTKHDYIAKPLRAIQSIIGEANTSRCWWKFGKIGTEEGWFRWYITARWQGRGKE